MNVPDEDLHARAISLMREHSMSYMEALSRAVASFANFQERSALSVPASIEHGSGGMTDAEIDHWARIYARQHCVSYSEALTAVCLKTANFSELPASISFSEAAQTIQGQWVDIFRAGAHRDAAGTARTFTRADIAEMASAYKPSVREAPLVVGHPETDGPAQGWVAALRATSDGVLQMSAKQVSERFAAAVQEGRFKKRSSSFYPPDHPGNPSPGKWYLRHVGFLGAQQPAIAALNDLRF